MATLIPHRPTAVTTETMTPTRQMLRTIATEFRSKAPADLDAKAWADRVEARIGAHPPEVLQEAARLLADRCRFWPTTAEVIDVVLEAHGRLATPMTPDGARMYDERQNAGRIIGGPDGRPRFVADLRLASLGYGEYLTGRGANLIIEELPEVTHEDVETAARRIAMRARDGDTAAKVHDQWAIEAALIALNRTLADARFDYWLPRLNALKLGSACAEAKNRIYNSMHHVVFGDGTWRRELIDRIDDTDVDRFCRGRLAKILPREMIGGAALAAVIERLADELQAQIETAEAKQRAEEAAAERKRASERAALRSAEIAADPLAARFAWEPFMPDEDCRNWHPESEVRGLTHGRVSNDGYGTRHNTIVDQFKSQIQGERLVGQALIDAFAEFVRRNTRPIAPAAAEISDQGAHSRALPRSIPG